VLRLRVDARRPAPPLGRALAEATRARTSSKVGIPYRPSKAVPRSRGRRSRARSVLSSASVKSSVNQPVMSVPSIVLAVRREANSGRLATSVVPEISFSWRQTRTPSFVATRSGSTKSAPCSIARR